MAAAPEAVLSLASGFPLLIVGALLLVVRPHRPVRVFFGAFVGLWGLVVATGVVGRVAGDADVHRVALLISFALVLPCGFFLAHFASMLHPSRWTRVATGVFGTAAAVGALALAFAGPLVLEGAFRADGVVQARYGPLFLPLILGPFFAAFYYALGIIYLEYRRARPGTPRRQRRSLLMALVLPTTYYSVRHALTSASPEGQRAFDAFAAPTGGQQIFFVLGTIFLAGVAFHLLWRPAPPEGIDGRLLTSFLFPALVAAGEVLLSQVGVSLQSLGFWRLLTAAFLVYAMAHEALFEIGLNLKRVAGPAAAFLLPAFGVPLFMMLAQGELGLNAVLLTLIPQVIGVAVVLTFSQRLGEVVGEGEARKDPEHRRKIELYRVALEEKLRRGGALDDADLRELRIRLGVSDEEHRLVALVVVPGAQRAPASLVQRLEPGAVALGRYRLDRLLGAGTTGRTFVAYDQSSRAEVAIKVVSRATLGGQAAEMLLREARLAASISHRFVIAIHDVAETPEAVLVVMDYADNGNLDDHLARRGGRLPLEEAVRFLDQLLEALHAIHRRNIVHRNLKPKNVLVEADGSIRVADFGAAIRGRADEVAEKSTNPVLSLPYMSPEQRAGRDVDARTDLYTAALLFHRTLAGHVYMPGKVQAQTGARRAAVDSSRILGLPPEAGAFEPFLRKALEHDPAHRFQTAAAMRAALIDAGAAR